VVANGSINTLYPLRHQTHYKAGRGEHGLGSNCHGKRGEDLSIDLPLGSIVRDAESGETLADLTQGGQRVRIARGGNGGWGNQHFATSTRQAPRFAKPGLPGEVRRLSIELKLLAEVAIIGLPNAGKSTLISAISAARPKIADYPFTTLTPNLGVVSRGDETLVVADIPGLIAGAHEGAGLGIRFLKHVERCRALCQLVDASVPGDAEADVATIEGELAAFSPAIARRPRVLVASKADAAAPERIESIRAAGERRNLPFFAISAAARSGLAPLINALFEMGKAPAGTDEA
jgi:GTP-binding protein